MYERMSCIGTSSISRILGAPVGERAWQQAQLPVAMGGMGLRGAEDHAPAAYAASVLASQPLSRALLGGRDGAGPVLSPRLLTAMSAAQGEEVKEEEVENMSQKEMSVKVDLHKQRMLMEGIGEEEVRERARLGSLSLPHAGDWLNTAPLTAIGLHLRPREFVLVAKYRMGLAVLLASATATP